MGGKRLDVSVGPRPLVSAVALTGMAGNQQGMDYLALFTMLARTIGSNMMQFSQSIAPQVGVVEATGGKTALATGKGFNQDQIAALKDACGVRNAQQIPPIWSVIQASKGKSFNTYCAHLAKSINLWCRLHHIDRNPPSLRPNSLKTLLPCVLTLGGQWRNSTLWRGGCQCWRAAC
jgi:hypothetical protein